MLTVSQAAAELAVSPATIYSLCAAGKLAHTRIGIGRGTIRITKKALADLVSEGQRAAGVGGQVTMQDLRASAALPSR